MSFKISRISRISRRPQPRRKNQNQIRYVERQNFNTRDDAVILTSLEAGGFRERVNITQELNGTDSWDFIISNTQESYTSYRQTHYVTNIFANGGNDIIIQMHEHFRSLNNHTQYLKVWGGEGKDTFVAASGNRNMHIKDMEAGEALITTARHIHTEQIGNTMYISHQVTRNGVIRRGNAIRIDMPAGHTLESEINEVGALQYTMVAPEQG